jgi:hypothetical protein
MMTDIGIRQQVERTDRFIEQLRDAIDAVVVDPESLCADDHPAGLQRISATLDAVPHVTMSNLANLNVAMRGARLSVLGVQLMCVGAGPTTDATAFLAAFQPAITWCWRAGAIEAARSFPNSWKLLPWVRRARPCV